MQTLKEKLRARKLTIGSWVTIGDAVIAEIMAKAGFDWLAIDMEHSAIDLNQAQKLIRVIELSGCVPLVRVSENSPNLIKRVMDAGSHGVIVPMVNTKDDAIRAVKSAKYPPSGIRGVGLGRAQGYGLGFEPYKEWIKENGIVIVQIEHKDAMDNLEDILRVDGIDASIIGPYDLSGSLGMPGDFKSPKMRQLIMKYVDICRKLKCVAGFHSVNPCPQEINDKISEGFEFLGFCFDALFMGASIKENLSRIKR